MTAARAGRTGFSQLRSSKAATLLIPPLLWPISPPRGSLARSLGSFRRVSHQLRKTSSFYRCPGARALRLRRPATSLQRTARRTRSHRHNAGAPRHRCATAAALASNVETPLTARWLDLETLSHSERYRNTYDNGGTHVFEDGQQRSLVQGKLKLDAAGRYIIGFRASSGRYFNWAYGDYAGHGFTYNLDHSHYFGSMWTYPQYLALMAAMVADPVGVNELNLGQSAGWQFYLRELYFSATPIKAVTVEFGSFGIERGLSSEITTFDDDGYISGERVRIHDAKHLFFDQIGYTNAFFGDATTVNLFDRGSDLKQSNYHQVFLDKRLNSHLASSGEFTNQRGTNTFREAALVNTKETRIIDSVRVELYQRLNASNIEGANIAGGNGFALTAQKTFTARMSGDAGFASVDDRYGVYNGRYFEATGWTLNGDSYGLGKRPFVHASYKVNPGITAFAFYTHAIGPREPTFNQQGLNAGLTFDLKAMINKEKLVF